MILETLGTVKILSALKCGATGLASSIPPLVNNSVAATEHMVATATPVVVKGATAAGHGAVVIGGMTAKGLMAAKAGAAKLGAKLAATVPATKGTLGSSLAVPTSGQAIADGVIKSVSFS